MPLGQEKPNSRKMVFLTPAILGCFRDGEVRKFIECLINKYSRAPCATHLDRVIGVTVAVRPP